MVPVSEPLGQIFVAFFTQKKGIKKNSSVNLTIYICIFIYFFGGNFHQILNK
jgi:hypothetical protein